MAMAARSRTFCITWLLLLLPVTVQALDFTCSTSNLRGDFFRGSPPTIHCYTLEGTDSVSGFYLPGSLSWEAERLGRPTALCLPQMRTNDVSFGVRQDQFGFKIDWNSGMTVVIKTCMDLVDPVWTPIQTITLNDDSFQFTDPQWTNYPARFYRIRSP